MKIKNINKDFQVLIPLRKGSKRIKFKNFVKINNKPLVYYTIKEVVQIFKKKNIFVSSNDPKAEKLSKKYNLNFIKRPEKLCSDGAKTEDAILHFIDYQKKRNLFIANNIILLQATSPLRTSTDILRSVKKFKKKNLDSLFSVYSEKSFLWMKKNKKLNSISFNYKKRERSQDMDKVYLENGTIYIFKKERFLKFKNRIFGKFDYHEMNKNNSVDIDSIQDLNKAQFLIKVLKEKK